MRVLGRELLPELGRGPGRGRGALALGAVALLAACRTDPATQIVVVIDTDIPASTLDGFATSVVGQEGRTLTERRFTLGEGAGDVRLPADYAIGPKGNDPDRRVRVEVDAMRGDEVLFETHAITRFRDERSLRLDMFLASRCLDEADTCGPDERCTEQGCVPEEIRPGELPLFGADAGAGDPPDGGTHGGVFDEVWSRLLWGGVATVDVAFDESGDLFVALKYAGGITAEGGGSSDAIDPANLLLLRYSREGDIVWSQSFPAGDLFYVADLALSAGGDLLVVGNFLGTFDFGDGGHSVSNPSPFVARFSGASGAHQWTKVFPSGVFGVVNAVAVDPDGVIGLAGNFTGSLDTDPEDPVDELAGVAELRQFLILLQDDGQTICEHTPPSPPGSITEGISITFDGTSPRVAGYFSGSANFGAGQRTSDGPDGYVAGYGPNCVPDPTLDIVIGGPNAPIMSTVTMLDGDLVVGGSVYSLAEIDGTSWGGFGDFDFLAVRYAGDPIVNIVGGSGADRGGELVALPDSGDLLLSGGLGSTDAVFGGERLVRQSPVEDALVMRFDDTAAEVGLLQIGGPTATVLLTSLDYHAGSGVAAVAGTLQGVAQFPAGPRDGEAGSAFVLVFVP